MSISTYAISFYYTNTKGHKGPKKKILLLNTQKFYIFSFFLCLYFETTGSLFIECLLLCFVYLFIMHILHKFIFYLIIFFPLLKKNSNCVQGKFIALSCLVHLYIYIYIYMLTFIFNVIKF